MPLRPRLCSNHPIEVQIICKSQDASDDLTSELNEKSMHTFCNELATDISLSWWHAYVMHFVHGIAIVIVELCGEPGLWTLVFSLVVMHAVEVNFSFFVFMWLFGQPLQKIAHPHLKAAMHPEKKVTLYLLAIGFLRRGERNRTTPVYINQPLKCPYKISPLEINLELTC